MPEPYLTVDDIRAPVAEGGLGITEDQASDTLVESAITLSQQLLERMTRNWFGPQEAEFSFDGNDADTMTFAIPIISVEWLRINDSTSNLDARYFKVYNGRGGSDGRDDRQNPKISLVRGRARDIYTAPLTQGTLRFFKGRQNHTVRGVFGHVESDGSTPKPIIEAMKRLIVDRLASPAVGTSQVGPLVFGGVVIEEETDGHRVRYSDQLKRKEGLTGITRDPFILDVVRLYRAPIGIAAPAHWSAST